MHVALRDRHHETEVRLDQLLLGGARAPFRLVHGSDLALERRGGQPGVALDRPQLALRGSNLLGEHQEVLAVDPSGSAALARARRAGALAQQLGNAPPGLAFDGVQLRGVLGGARGRAIEAGDELLDLPAVQAEPAEGREEPRLAAEPLLAPFSGVLAPPVVCRLTGPRRRAAALVGETAEGRELFQEAAAVRLVVFDRLALLVGPVAHEVPQAHLAGP